MRRLRAFWRVLSLLSHIAHGLWVVAVRFPALPPDQQHVRVQVWSQQLLARMGVHLRVVGQPPVTGPLVGTLATAAGTLYIERSSRRDALRMVQTMQEALERGEVLAVFPEGTTGDGREMLPFHANLIQAAVAAQAPVQPVALRFVDKASGSTSFAPSYIGDETLVGSIWRTLCADSIEAVVHFGPVEQPEGRDRRAWAQDLHATIDQLRQG